MKDQEPLAELRAQYARALQETQAALLALSASVFNRPQAHDCVRSSDAFERWRACRERSRQLELRIERIDRAC